MWAFLLTTGLGNKSYTPESLRPNVVQYISYNTTDNLQAMTRFALHECDREQVFSLRPQVGRGVVTLTHFITNKPLQTIHLMITRANQRASLIAHDFIFCLEKLVLWLGDRGVSNVHFPILDSERPVYILANLYQIMMDLLAGTNISVILHNRVYVSILGIEIGNELPLNYPNVCAACISTARHELCRGARSLVLCCIASEVP